MATTTMIYELDKLPTDSNGNVIQIIDKALAIQEKDGSGAGTASATLQAATRYLAIQPLDSNGWFAFSTDVADLVAGKRYATMQGVPFFIKRPAGTTKVVVIDR